MTGEPPPPGWVISFLWAPAIQQRTSPAVAIPLGSGQHATPKALTLSALRVTIKNHSH
jgi:hypothetical protein